MYTPRPQMPGRVILATAMIAVLAGASLLTLLRGLSAGWFAAGNVIGWTGGALAVLGLAAGFAAVNFRAGRAWIRRLALGCCLAIAILTGAAAAVAFVLGLSSGGLGAAIALFIGIFAVGFAALAVTASVALMSAQARDWFGWAGDLVPEQDEWRPARAVPAVMIATGVAALLVLILLWSRLTLGFGADALGIASAVVVGAMGVPVAMGAVAARVIGLAAAAVGSFAWGLDAIASIVSVISPGDLGDAFAGLFLIALAGLNITTVVLLTRRGRTPDATPEAG
ncbi:hypothetical protein Afil01_62630 [Actinorhabdospora filicis]|uniref:Uncharacterized protein n=1 Tax=Actinorhabdospora filicis TaxID=1785913 RepID=A0A9W6WDC0_9ACTN|nr:hypothetical protein [Actinorhabdospora filicis]GLZ81456.1 hypothetical protein Afil01_62630 [Actinorhabdospora filicis]